MRPKMLHGGGPLVRTKPYQLARAGVERVPRVTGVREGRPVLADGRALDVTNVVWATGFHPGFSWIDLPIFGADGLPEHQGGEVAREPGLYFVGLHFLYAMSSAMIHGVGRDAKRIAATIAARAPSSRPQAQAQVLSVAG
jgi:putative flavoprotein involved in K+ transport